MSIIAHPKSELLITSLTQNTQKDSVLMSCFIAGKLINVATIYMVNANCGDLSVCVTLDFLPQVKNVSTVKCLLYYI